MKLQVLLALLLLALPGVAGIPGSAAETGLRVWGRPVNPANDCKFKADGSRLFITVPGSDEAHDLSPELGKCTAPRLVQAVEGDFIIQVRIDGEFQPGEESTQRGRTGYTGAGLVIFADEKNFVRIERATLQSGGVDATPYTNFEIRVDGELERMGTTGDLPTEKDKPTWLRLERRSQKILGAMSQDGEHWKYGEPKELRAEAWNGKGIVAGVAAISTSRKDFTPIYSGFTIQRADKAEPLVEEKPAPPEGVKDGAK